MCFRTALLLSFGKLSELLDFKLNLLQAYWVGFRFDTTILTYGFALLFLLNLFTLVLSFPARQGNIMPHRDEYDHALARRGDESPPGGISEAL